MPGHGPSLPNLTEPWASETGDFPPMPREWYGGAPNIEVFLDQHELVGSRGTLRRLLTEVSGLLPALSGVVGQMLPHVSSSKDIRLLTNDDSPPKIIVEFPVKTPEQAISLTDEMDRWMINRPGVSTQRIIVDTYYL